VIWKDKFNYLLHESPLGLGGIKRTGDLEDNSLLSQ